jgi:TonB-linked SusC/RagA family outer membrane protein
MSSRNDLGTSFDNALRMAPYVPVYDDNNWWGYGNNNNVNDNNNADNPWTSVEYEESKSRDNVLFGNIYGSVDIIEGLTYYATVSLNYNHNFGSYWVREHVNSNEMMPTQLQETYTWGMWPKFEQTLTFARTFNRHDFTVLAGMSMDKYGTGRSLGMTGVDFPNENLQNMMLAGENMIRHADIYVGTSLSYFGRLNYSFDNKYLLTAIIRRDGSDKFSAENRWGTFPSVSAAWKIHQENFIADAIPSISTLKLRAGWGKVGIDAIGSFQYSSYIHSIGMSYPVGLPGASTYLSGSTIKALSSPDIKWEEATTMNIGVDLGFLRNKLTATVDLFSKETADILVAVPTSPSMGLGLAGGTEGGSRVANAATATNKGIEALVSYMNYDSEFKYGITATFSYINNEVTGLGQGEPITGPQYNGQAHMTYTDIGHPIGAFYGFKVDEIYINQGQIDADNAAALEASGGEVAYYQSDLTSPGDIRFLDLDGNGYIDDADRDYIGSPIPKYNYGLVLDAAYKGFDFSMTLSGVAGVDIYSAYYTWSLLGMRLTSNHLSDVTDRWTTTNTDASLPRAISNDPNNNLRTSDRYVYKGGFLKFRNISLGYTLPSNLINRLGISQLRVYVTAQNAITISDYIGYDPEVSSSVTDDPNGYNLGRGIDTGFTPIPRTFLAGIQVSF